MDSSIPDLETEINGLRKLICLYMAANIEVVRHTSFMDLITGRGAFVRDLWKRVVPKKPNVYPCVPKKNGMPKKMIGALT